MATYNIQVELDVMPRASESEVLGLNFYTYLTKFTDSHHHHHHHHHQR